MYRELQRTCIAIVLLIKSFFFSDVPVAVTVVVFKFLNALLSDTATSVRNILIKGRFLNDSSLPFDILQLVKSGLPYYVL